MNRNLLIILVAAVLLLLCLLAESLGLSGSLGLLGLPFVLAAKGLRWLSLSGSAGNAGAIGLLLILCCLPLLLKGRGKWKPEDTLLGLTCLMMLYCMYYLINPSLRAPILAGQTGQLILCGSVYSLLLSWAVLRLLQSTEGMSSGQFYQALGLFLMICAAECLLSGLVCVSGLPGRIGEIKEANTMPGLDLFPTYAFLFLSRAVAALEYGLDALVLFMAARLLKQLCADPYSAESCAASQNIIRWCRRSLAIIILSNTGLLLGQLFFAQKLHSLDTGFRVPVLSLAIVFSLLALASLLHKGRQLQEDSELFI